MKFGMGTVRPVIRDGLEEVAQDRLEPQRDGIHSRQLGQAGDKMPQAPFVWGFEGFADQLVEFFANSAASQSAPGPFPLDLQFADEMKVAELKDPVMLFGNSLHAIQIVDDKRARPKLGFGGKMLEYLFPAKSALFARQEQGIEEDSGLSRTRLHGHEVEHPGPSAEVKAQAVGQEGERPAGKCLGIGAGHKALKHLSKSITEIRQGNLRPAVGQVPKREPFEKDLVEDLGGHPDTRATALAGANRPGSFAATALPAPASKVQDFGLTTRGFRMLSVHTRELSRRSSKAQMEKPASSLNLSTEFLYPTPFCDLKFGLRRQTLYALCVHRTGGIHGVLRTQQRTSHSGQHRHHDGP